MGTRSAIAIVIDGTVKASYNHYDGYPTGVGAGLQKELAGVDLWSMSENARKIDWVNAQDEVLERDALRAQAAGYDFDPSVGNRGDYYSLLRNDHGSLMNRINLGLATDESEFPKDSLFCEWCYLFNFDTEEVEVLEGFNKDEAKQHPLFAFKREDWQPSYEGEKLEYWACSPKWKGTLAEFKALDMKSIE